MRVAVKLQLHPESGIGFKNCPACDEKKPVWEFYKSKSRPCGYYTYCRECYSKKDRVRRIKSADKRRVYNRKHHLEKQYGLTLEDYQNMLDKQKDACAICGQPEIQTRNGRVRPLVVDHCHETGKIRKLLCNRCNTTIGYVDDSIKLLEKMVVYLKEHTIE